MSRPQFGVWIAVKSTAYSLPQFFTSPMLKFTLEVNPRDGIVDSDWIASSVVCVYHVKRGRTRSLSHDASNPSSS